MINMSSSLKKTSTEKISSGLAFNGELLEGITGNYLLGKGKRTFNPALMRFISPDPLSPFDAGDINAYAYCSGDPINYTDPSGQSLIGVMVRFSIGIIGRLFHRSDIRLVQLAGAAALFQNRDPRTGLVNFPQVHTRGRMVTGAQPTLEGVSHIPHIMDKIYAELSIRDKHSLTATSTTMRRITLQHMPPLELAARHSPATRYYRSKSYTKSLWDILQLRHPKYVPAQLTALQLPPGDFIQLTDNFYRTLSRAVHQLGHEYVKNTPWGVHLSALEKDTIMRSRASEIAEKLRTSTN